MRYFLLITSPEIRLATLRAELAPTFDVPWIHTEKFAVREGGQYAWVLAGRDVVREYRDKELARIGIDDPQVFLLTFRSIRFVRRVLGVIADDARVWVDLDTLKGDILPGPELVARMRREPDWTLEVPTTTGD